MDAVSSDERPPADFHCAKLAFADQLVNLRCSDAERLPRACNGDGERFHVTVSRSDPHCAGPAAAPNGTTRTLFATDQIGLNWKAPIHGHFSPTTWEGLCVTDPRPRCSTCPCARTS